MQKVFEQISQADGIQIHDLLDAVMDRMRELYPEWDTGTISIRKSGNIIDEIDRSIRVLESLKRIQKNQGDLKTDMQLGKDSIHVPIQEKTP